MKKQNPPMPVELLSVATPANFAITASSGKWIPVAHLRYLSKQLALAAAGKMDRLMIFMPPRHGKSELASKYFPAWYLGLFPDRRVILVSSDGESAAGWGRKVRDIISEVGFETFEVEVSETSSAAHRWDIAGHTGGMITAGVGGTIVGKGAHLLIMDDLIKSDEQVFSKTFRDGMWDWYRSTAYPRLEPGAIIVLITTRWHEDDIAGRLLNEEKAGGDSWTVIKFPAIAEENDVLGRQPGQVLWPERFPKAEILRKKKVLQDYWFSAVYQQRPAPAEGGAFKRSWWQYYNPLFPPVFEEVIQSWDLAFKDTKTSAYVCGQVWGRIGADRYALDQVRDRLNFIETLSAVTGLSAKWPEAHLKLIEDKANGPAVISVLRKRITGIIPYNPVGSKEARAAAVSPTVQSGNVYLPRGASWVPGFIEEHAIFPNSTYKDQVDTAVQALLHFEQGQRVALRARSVGGH